MATQGKNWLMGCGIGCVVLTLGLVLLIGGGALFLKNTLGGWRAATSAQEELLSQLGEVESFEPTLAGGLAAERLEVFLQVLDQTQAVRSEVAAALLTAQTQLDDSSGKLNRLWRTIQAGSRLGPLMATFTQARAEALLAAGMSPGEYLYLYSLIYHCWLGHDPAGGLEQIVMAMGDGDGSFTIHVDDHTYQSEDPQDLGRQVRHQLNAHHRRWLRALLHDAAVSTELVDPAAFVDDAERELERLRDDQQALPWTEDFPAAWQQDLEPYRFRLLSAWDPWGNLIELFGMD